MRISGNSFTDSVYQLYQKNQYTPQETTFNDLLRSAASDVQNAKEPKLQLWADYQAWKSQQPARILPDSKGATEENLAYLLENFTGNLSLFQRIEVVDTMREMGILTEDQMMDALGLGKSGWVTADPACTIVVTGPAGDRNMEAWSSFFYQLPLTKMNDLDDLFVVLDRQLRANRAEDVADDLREAFDRVKQEVQGGVIAHTST